MDIVEQYARLTDTISQLEHQATALRLDLMRSGLQVAGTQCAVVAQPQADRAFNTELWPRQNDPQCRNVALRKEVGMRPVAAIPAFVRPEAQKQVDLLRYRC